jgi:hypothetical protein
MAEGRADTDRPADDLVFEVWLHKTAMEAVIAHYEAIADRMSALADEVAQQFVAFDRDVGFHVEVASPADALAGIHVVSETRPAKDGVLRRVVTTTQGYSSGMVLASSMFALVPTLVWLPFVTLPVAGLMSDLPIERVRELMDDMLRAAHQLGSPLHDPFMAMSFLALPVIPSLKLTDHGLVDVDKFQLVSLFV